MVYLLKVYNMNQVGAANVISIWNGVSNFIPIIGAFIADAYVGKFRTIAVASFATLLVCSPPLYLKPIITLLIETPNFTNSFVNFNLKHL